jgi:hypothetical protein
MVVDFMTKPLQGSHFRNLRDYIMGRVGSTKFKHDVISVSKKTNKAVTKKSKVNGRQQAPSQVVGTVMSIIVPQECDEVYRGKWNSVSECLGNEISFRCD